MVALVVCPLETNAGVYLNALPFCLYYNYILFIFAQKAFNSLNKGLFQSCVSINNFRLILLVVEKKYLFL